MRLPFSILEPLLEAARAAAADRGPRHDARPPEPPAIATRSPTSAATAPGSTWTRTSTSARRRCRSPPTSRTSWRFAPRAATSIATGCARGFSHLIIGDELLEQLGPAVNAGKAVFLYGPPGNGKTVIAEGMGRALGGDMYVPYAIDVDGQIITMFDPVNHESLESAGDEPVSIVRSAPRDRRWVRIRRPVVMVGGELTLDMLDLTFNPISKFYEAPLQLKANGGVFLVDDFGRQRMRPEDLLNRWIVPLESRVDYLTLHTGKKFQVPFDVLIVFATNLDPLSLADEAFLRRIPYKIPIDDPTLEQFTEIFELNCQRKRPAVPSGDGRRTCIGATTRRSAGRCARASRATCSTRSPRCAATAGTSRSSPGSCSTRPAAPTSSTTSCSGRTRTCREPRRQSGSEIH